MKKQYTKLPTSIPEQLIHLQKRGMLINDQSRCTTFLSRVSYYKIRGYWICFENNKPDNLHKFKSGTYLDTIIDAYEMDFHIRSLLFKILSELEMAIKSQFVGLSAQINSGHLDNNIPASHFYMSKNLFDLTLFDRNIVNIQEEFRKNKSKLVFINAYKNKYTNPVLPPVWSAVELMSFGDITKWIRSLSNMQYASFLSDMIGWHKLELDNFLFLSTTVRNMCAHHNKLFDSVIYGTPKYPQQFLPFLNSNRGHKLWNSLIMVLYVLHKLNSNLVDTYISDLKQITKNQSHLLLYYGFPKDWETKINMCLKIN